MGEVFMKTEVEARLLDVDEIEFQEKLKETILMEDTKLMQLKINMKTEELNVNLMEKLLTLRQ